MLSIPCRAISRDPRSSGPQLAILPAYTVQTKNKTKKGKATPLRFKPPTLASHSEISEQVAQPLHHTSDRGHFPLLALSCFSKTASSSFASYICQDRLTSFETVFRHLCLDGIFRLEIEIFERLCLGHSILHLEQDAASKYSVQVVLILFVDQTMVKNCA
jgi:hypothetical protein